MLINLLTFQEEQPEDDSFQVAVPTSPSKCRLGTPSDTIHVPQLHQLICARKLP